MYELLKNFNKKIRKEVEGICDLVLQKDDVSLDIFDSPSCFSKCPQNHPRPTSLWGRHGIYIFLIEHDEVISENKVRKWNELNQGASFKNYKPYDLKQGDCLYVGDCVSFSLYTRIRQHFANQESYSSLKLNNPARNFLLNNVKIYAFPIKNVYTEEMYRVILPTIEKRLHELLQPKCGSSRT